jgi:acylglycerol lipase
MKHTESVLTARDGLRLYTQCWQPDAAPAAVVCLVHGLGEHGGRYVHMADFLTRHGYTLFSLDLRGHGKSNGKRGHAPTYEALLDDIAVFLQQASKQFAGVPLVLYGHSLGGGLVLNYGLRRKPALAGVVVTGPTLRLSFTPSPVTMTLGKVLYRIAPAMQMASGLDRKGLARDQAVIDAYGADPLVHDRISARLGMDFIDAGTWALHHAGEWMLPLLLMHGADDRLSSADGSREFATKAGAQCTLRVWDGLYHEIHNEPEQQQVFEVVLRWLQSTVKAS